MYILYSMYKIMKFCIEIVGVFTYWWFVTSNNKYLLSFQPFYELFMQWGQKSIFNYDFCHHLLSPSKYLHEDDISHQGGEYVCIRLTLNLLYNFRQNFFQGDFVERGEVKRSWYEKGNITQITYKKKTYRNL